LTELDSKKNYKNFIFSKSVNDVQNGKDFVN